MIRETTIIVDELLANPAGATITADTEKAVPTTGYVVGVEGIVAGVDDLAAITAWVAAKVAEVAATERRYFGVWIDTRTGTAYFDIVDVVDDLDDALALAKDRGEIAIYDLANGIEVRV